MISAMDLYLFAVYGSVFFFPIAFITSFLHVLTGNHDLRQISIILFWVAFPMAFLALGTSVYLKTIGVIPMSSC